MPKTKTAAKAKKPAAKKSATKNPTINSNAFKSSVMLQYGEKSVPYDDLVAKVKDIWTNALGRKIIDIDNVDLYIKPEENKVYYVVNGSESGDFDL
ncbi:MAG: DUF6465 family protein [Lachnospiraceae bacterium]|nr:DUF6465 family protein [Lachnospiraceae bacterium]